MNAESDKGEVTTDRWRILRRSLVWCVLGWLAHGSVKADVTGPYILAQPTSRSADQGTSVKMNVSAGGSAPLYYQWQFNGANIQGATLNRFTLSNAQPTNSGAYTVVVTNAFGSTTSRIASVTIYPPQLTVFSDTFDNNSRGRWVVNSSSADTSAVFNYDYSTNGILSAPHSIPGTARALKLQANGSNGTPAAVSLSPIGQSFFGDYRLRFDMWLNSNGPFPAGGPGSTQLLTAGIGTSGQSIGWTNPPGSDGYWFAVDSHGGLPDSAGLADFNAIIGSLPEPGSSGIYWAGANATSRDNNNPYYAADFPGGQKPPLLQQTNYAQQTGALTQGTVGFVWCDVIIAKQGDTVEWSLNGLKIATVTNAALTGSNVFVGYWDPFAASSDRALCFGLIANLRIDQPIAAPAVVVQPRSQAVNQGATASFSVVASGIPAPAYQWRFNGTNLTGATNSSYTVTNVQPNNVGSYSVVLTNMLGSATSWPALLTLTVPPSITLQPLSQYVNEGEPVTFNVAVVGTLPLAYEWGFVPSNSAARVNYPWSSGSSITLTNAQLNDAGTYSVVVSNVAGMVVSSNATLRVNLRPVADASATSPLKISSNGTNAIIVLDGSRSYDLDGDALQYVWLRPGSPIGLAIGMVASVTLPVGINTVELIVSDPLASSTHSINVTVLTTSQAVQRLNSTVRNSGLVHTEPLLAATSAAMNSIERGNVKTAVNQLQAFESMTSAQVVRVDQALAAQFISQAEQVMDALNATGGKKSGKLSVRGQGRLSFAGEPRQIYILEASTNLSNWEAIGSAAADEGGLGKFQDKSAVKFPNRFYRIISP